MKKYILLAIVAIGFGAWYFSPSMESIVKKLVHQYGSEVTGTSVDMSGFSLSLLKGEGNISEITVANPQGYKQPYLFELQHIAVKVDIASLTKDVIVVDLVEVNKPVITYEMLSLQQNNVKQIQENIAKNLPKAEKTETVAKKEEAKEGQKSKDVLIKRFVLKGATLKVYIPGAGEQSVVLPEIVLTDIGGKNVSPAQQISKIFNTILKAASQVVVSSNLGNLENVAKDNLNTIKDSVKGKVNLKGIF